MLYDPMRNEDSVIHFSEEDISHLLGFAEVFGPGKDKAFEDDEELSSESDIEEAAKKLTASPVNFVTTIISNIARESQWEVGDSINNGALYLEKYSKFLNALGSSKYIEFYDSQAQIHFDTQVDESELANLLVSMYKYADPYERESLFNELVQKLSEFLRISEAPHDYIYYIEPIMKADDQVKLYYNCIYSSNPSNTGSIFNCISHEIIFDPAQLTLENARIELDKIYNGLKDWIRKNKVKKTP